MILCSASVNEGLAKPLLSAIDSAFAAPKLLCPADWVTVAVHRSSWSELHALDFTVDALTQLSAGKFVLDEFHEEFGLCLLPFFRLYGC